MKPANSKKISKMALENFKNLHRLKNSHFNLSHIDESRSDLINSVSNSSIIGSSSQTHTHKSNFNLVTILLLVVGVLFIGYILATKTTSNFTSDRKYLDNFVPPNPLGTRQ